MALGWPGSFSGSQHSSSWQTLSDLQKAFPAPAAENRVKKLTDALTEATNVIAEIEREVEARTKLAERLQKDVQRHQELLKLNRTEVEAVTQTFRMEVKSEGRRAFWLNLFINRVLWAWRLDDPSPHG